MRSPALVRVSPALVGVSPALVRVSPALVRVSPALVGVSPALVRVSPALVGVSPALVKVSLALVRGVSQSLTIRRHRRRRHRHRRRHHLTNKSLAPFNIQNPCFTGVFYILTFRHLIGICMPICSANNNPYVLLADS